MLISPLVGGRQELVWGIYDKTDVSKSVSKQGARDKVTKAQFTFLTDSVFSYLGTEEMVYISWRVCSCSRWPLAGKRWSPAHTGNASDGNKEKLIKRYVSDAKELLLSLPRQETPFRELIDSTLTLNVLALILTPIWKSKKKKCSQAYNIRYMNESSTLKENRYNVSNLINIIYTEFQTSVILDIWKTFVV